VETPDEPRTTIADDPAHDLHVSKPDRLVLEERERRRLRRHARHVTDHVACGRRVAPAARGCPRNRDIHPPWQRSEPAAHRRNAHFGALREVGEPCCSEESRRAARRERSNAYRTFGGERLREEQNAAAGSRCLPSRGPEAAISRGADGPSHVRTRLASASNGDCSPHEGTKDLLRRALLPSEAYSPLKGTTSVAEDAFSTAGERRSDETHAPAARDEQA